MSPPDHITNGGIQKEHSFNHPHYHVKYTALMVSTRYHLECACARTVGRPARAWTNRALRMRIYQSNNRAVITHTLRTQYASFPFILCNLQSRRVPPFSWLKLVRCGGGLPRARECAGRNTHKGCGTDFCRSGSVREKLL